MIAASDPLAELRLSIVGLVHRQGSEEFRPDVAAAIESWILREPVGEQAGDSGESTASSEGTQSRGNGPGQLPDKPRNRSNNHS